MLLAGGCLAVSRSMMSGSLAGIANGGGNDGGGEGAAGSVRLGGGGFGFGVGMPRIWSNRALTKSLLASSASAVGVAGADGSAGFGAAGWMLLRSRLPSLEIRADCSEGYEADIVPTYARTSPFSSRPLGPVAGILSASEVGMSFWRSNCATEG